MSKPFRTRIELPVNFKNKINEDSDVAAAILRAIDDFSLWLGRNQTIFFPEYTDHGIDHVTNVLISAEKLISDDSWALLTSNDCAAIIASILLHDCAMHLTQDGFLELIDGVRSYPLSKIFSDDREWRVEFDLFQQEAARWDALRLVSVFGDADPAELVADGKSMSDRQRLLIGEFLRRHHARLAHQIALDGVPGVDGDLRFSPFSSCDRDLCDIYGFLARSHNLSIRDAADSLPAMRRRLYLNIHAPYVMFVLRISDYIQIDAARAPTQILQLRGLKSPVSRYEWAKHHAVLELHQAGEDPEAMNVIADPKSIEIFSGLRLLFKDLQRELDESWALLGEVYGRFDDLNQLGLKVRRLISNLDNPVDFESQNRPSYIPEEMRLSTATAELLHLLVGPLYGNKPSIGVRELIQNSVDATLERLQYVKRHQRHLSFNSQIEVEVEMASDGPSWLRVSDNGIGMTLDTVKNFFLRAGASFRRSQWWKNEYSDDSGKSTVRRSGRFGIGVLAAFLIGEKITVKTRHILDETGYGLKFNLTLDGGLVQVSRVEADVGTTIEVELTREAAEKLVDEKVVHYGDVYFTEWYLFDSPEIIYRIFRDSEWSRLPSEKKVNPVLSNPDSPWVVFSADDFGLIYWSYDFKFTGHDSFNPFVACNGIFIGNEKYDSDFPDISAGSFRGSTMFAHPALLVDDPDGRLPLNIQRDGLAESTYPFHEELIRSMADCFARELYLSLQIPASLDSVDAVFELLEVRLGKYGVRGNLIALSRHGWLPLDETLLADVIPKIVVYEIFDGFSFDCGIKNLDYLFDDGAIFIPCVNDKLHSYSTTNFVRELLENDRWRDTRSFEMYSDQIIGFRFSFRDDVLQRLLKKGHLPKYLWRQFREVFSADGWKVFDVGLPGFDAEDAELLVNKIHGTDCRAIALVSYATTLTPYAGGSGKLSSFAQSWKEIVPDLWTFQKALSGGG